MTLVIDLFDPGTGPYSYLNALDNDAAGGESFRKQVWGSDALVSRGAVFLPQLRDSDLFVFPVDLPAFANECRMISTTATEIATDIWSDPDCATSLHRYTATFLAAIELAIQRDAGVCIS